MADFNSSLPVVGSQHVTQSTDPWVTLGSMRMIPGDRVAGSIVNMPIVGVSGTALAVSGIVNQGTDPWITLGSLRLIPGDDVPIVGSVYQLSTPGSVAIYGDITTSDDSVGEIGSPHLGSAAVIAGDWGGSTAVVLMDNGSYVLVAGSISSLPDVTQASTTRQITAGSTIILSNGGSIPVFNVAGSIITYDPIGVGSVRALYVDSANTLTVPFVDVGSYLMIAGSISSMPSITTTADNVGELGSPHLGSAALIAGDWGGSTAVIRMDTGSWALVVGSISTLPDINLAAGSVRILSNAGSIPVWNVAGSIIPYNPVGIGSVQLVPGSLEVYQTTASDMIVDIGNIGSVRIIPGDRVPGSIVNLPDVNIGAGSVIILSSTGSVSVYGGDVTTSPGARTNLLADYETDASVSAGDSGLHAFTSTGSLYVSRVLAGFSGKGKVSVHISGDGAQETRATAFNSTANPNILLDFGESNGLFVGNGSIIIIERNNREASNSQDVYSTIIGYTVT